MAKISELIDDLQTLKDVHGDIPVYWGIHEKPCWEFDRDYRKCPIRLDWDFDYNPYVYLADYQDVEKLQYQIHLLGHLIYDVTTWRGRIKNLWNAATTRAEYYAIWLGKRDI